MKMQNNIDINTDAEQAEIFKTFFMKYNQNKFNEFSHALETGDIKTAYRIAHTIKGNAAQLNKEALRKIAEETEALLKNEENHTTKEIIAAFETEFNSVLKDFSRDLKENV